MVGGQTVKAPVAYPATDALVPTVSRGPQRLRPPPRETARFTGRPLLAFATARFLSVAARAEAFLARPAAGFALARFGSRVVLGLSRVPAGPAPRVEAALSRRRRDAGAAAARFADFLGL